MNTPISIDKKLETMTIVPQAGTKTNYSSQTIDKMWTIDNQH